MGIDVKSIIVDAMLQLCEEKHLKKITIGDIQAKSGISRQTFYNHFKDKLDLIQYIYEHRIIADWKRENLHELNYYNATVNAFKNDLKYRKFLRQACEITGTNCLVDFMYKHSQTYDRDWHQSHNAGIPLTKEQKFSSDYHSVAGIYMRIHWILGEIDTTPEELAKNILRSRLMSLNSVIFEPIQSGEESGSPYVDAAKKMDFHF